nr:global nitrogen regulator [Cavernulicola chilensis]
MDKIYKEAFETYIKDFKTQRLPRGFLIKAKTSYIYILLGGIIQYSGVSCKYIHKRATNSKILIFDQSLFGNFESNSSVCTDCCYYKCITSVEYVKVSSIDLLNIIKKNQNYLYSLLQRFNQRLIDTENLFNIISHREIKNRLAHFLLLLATYYGISLKKGITINVKISHATIASILNTTRVTITRLIGNFKKENIIQIQGRKIIILQPIALSNFVSLTES